MGKKPSPKREYSASYLAKTLGMNSQEVFNRLIDLKYIVRDGNNWGLTSTGKNKGGQYKEGTHGRYIAWPESVLEVLDESPINHEQKFVTATVIGKQYSISATRINSIFSELGWITKDIKGWQITDFGKRLGGVQSRYHPSGVPYIRWPETFINNRLLKKSIAEVKGEVTTGEKIKISGVDSKAVEFRDKFRPEYRAQDGHYVRSKAEIIIDNWLYVSKIVHAYERKLPIEENLYCDFYIPKGNVYIEYWGSEEEKYLARKKKKLEIYKKYDFKLIELTDNDVYNLDDILPGKLLEFKIPIE